MEKKNMMWMIAVMAVVAGVIGVMATSPTGNVVGAKGAETANPAAESAPVKEFVMQSYTEIVDGKYYPKFSPNEITVNKGDRVRIKVTNIKGMHDFNIDEFGVSAETPLNQEVVVEFVADKTGNYEYYCSKPGHRQNGHWGTLKVLE